MQSALRTTEERLRHIVEHAQDLIYYCDATGHFTFVNPAAVRIMKYSEEELLGRHFLTLIRDDFRAAAGAHYARQIAEQIPTTYLEFPAVAKDGAVIWVGQHVQLVCDRVRPMAVHAIARVITAQKQTEERLTRSEERQRAIEAQLRRAQHLEAFGLVARGVAHDFNNVLAAILGNADLLALRMKDDPIGREDADDIREAAQRGAALARQLAAFGRRQRRDPSRVDLLPFVANLTPALERAAGAQCAIAIDVAVEAIAVNVVPEQLEQALVHLVANARDALPQGGPIEVEVSAVDLDAATARRYPGIPPGRYARVAVRDRGVGIDPKVQAHIYEPFFTTKGSDAAGLGLSIVQGMTRDAGGAVTCETIEGSGTTFEVMLPSIPTTSLDPDR